MPKEREVAALGRVVREGFIVSLEHLDTVSLGHLGRDL